MLPITPNQNLEHFEGLDGIKKLYRVIMNSWKPKDEYVIATAPLESFLKLEDFFINEVHKKRVKDKVSLKILINRSGENFCMARKNMPYSQVRSADLNTQTEYGVLNDILFLVDYSDQPHGLIIRDPEFAKTFRLLFDAIWSHGQEVKIPELVITEKTIEEILVSYKDKKPIIVTDPFNHESLQKFGETVCVENNDFQYVEQVRTLLKQDRFLSVVGVGGCTALDVARQCATEKIKAILLPTLLSTVCISVDKAVFHHNGEDKVFQTENPSKVIISMPAIVGARQEDIARWSQSGFGDMFAKVGASIDVAFRAGKIVKNRECTAEITRKIPETIEALRWTIGSFTKYNHANLKKLAYFLHEASVATIIFGGFGLSGGAEHDLAYSIRKKHGVGATVWPTHGQIVSIGTLIEIYEFGLVTGDMSLYNDLVTAYKKVGLPTNYAQCEEMGMKKEYIVEGLRDISHLNTFLSHYGDEAIVSLDTIFGI